MIRSRLLAALPALLLCLPVTAQDPPAPTPKPAPAGAVVGSPAPKFRLNDDGGALTSVGGKSKKWTVLAFYPKAATGG